jgi:uncharacterized CHY-type Zn-finger protein
MNLTFIKEIIIEIVKGIAFVLLLPIMILAVVFGFRTCWQCHETKHKGVLIKYDGCMFDKKPLVCEECYLILNRKSLSK